MQPSPAQITHASSLLHRSLPVAFPTETVYGLGCNALNSDAVRSVFQVKGRPADNPLIVHCHSVEHILSLYPSLPSAQSAIPRIYSLLASHFWPGPMTLLYPAPPCISPLVTCNLSTVGIRIPNNSVALSLIRESGLPIAAPSANSSGKPSPTSALHVLQDLGDKIQCVLDGGECIVGLESTVIDGFTVPGTLSILRPGGLTLESLKAIVMASEEFWGTKVEMHKSLLTETQLVDKPSTPGMKYRHYSPDAPVTLLVPRALHEVVQRPEASVSSTTSAGKPLIFQTLTSMSLQSMLQQKAASVLLLRPDANIIRLGLVLCENSNLCREFPLESGVHSIEGQMYDCHLFPLGPTNEPAVTARRIFAALQAMDKLKLDFILVEAVSEENEGCAVMNRLRKAAGSGGIVLIDNV